MNLHDEIAVVAYELYETRGCIHGSDLDDWLAAERIVLSGHAGQEIEEPEDVDVSAEIAPNNPDFFRFTLASRATVTAETYGAADGDTTVCFLDADGGTIVCDDDGGSKLWSLAQFELDPGTYFVKVELYAGTQPVAYHLLVRIEE